MNILHILANDNYFIYNKDIAKTMGTDVAIILGLLCNKYNYYEKQNKLTIIDGKEYFYCTREHIYNETGLKESGQRKSMKILEDQGILEHKKIGIPSKNYYYINIEKLAQILEISSSAENKELEVSKNNDLSLKNNTQILYNKNNIEKNINLEYIPENEEIKKENSILKENIDCIIQYLNQSIGTNYKPNSKSTIKLIKARFNDGFVLDDFYDVIDKKVKEWKNTEMEKYLRPETLFGNKFESYLNQKTYFKGNAKSSFSSKPTFDNTASHIIPTNTLTEEEWDKLNFEDKKKYLDGIPLADLTPKQLDFHYKYCLARNTDGSLMKF